MKRQRPVEKAMLLAVVGAFTLGAVCKVVAGESKIVLQEQLNRRWVAQLVSYPFQAPAGQCRASSLELNGPRGPQAVQLFDVQCWPGTESVQSGRVAFVVDELLPLAANTYILRYGAGDVTPVAAGLAINTGASQVEIATPRIAARLPLGSRVFDPPAAPAKAPGPIAALRIGDEPWFGGSELYGPGAVKEWSAKLIDHGPVFARVETVYSYADGAILKLQVRASAGENTIRVDMDVAGEQTNDGWRMTLNPGAKFTDIKTIYGVGTWMREGAAQVPDSASDKPLLYLSPWAGDYWFPDSPQIIRLMRAGAPELQLCVRDVGDWVVPQPRPSWANFATWSNAWVTPPQMWAGWQSRRVPLLAAGGGGISMQISLMPGRRHWSMTADADGTAVMDTFLRKEITTHCNLPLLDEVKDMALVWPAGAAGQVAGESRSFTTNPVLNKLGNIDLFRMNEGMQIFALCRSLMNSGSPVERRLNRAQMAYLAYMAADPRHWSFERGYNSGNPNMTVTRVCNIGLFGLTLTDHPRSREWFEYANDWMKYWMAETVTDKGYWPESAHYTEVSLAAMQHFASASAGNNTGYRVSDDPKYKALQLLYHGKIATPDGRIVHHGRGIGCHLGGSRQAGWTSEHIDHYGFVLRSHAATPGENFLLYLPYRAQCADGEIWPHQVASIASWYAAGKPVAGWHSGANTQPNWAFKPHVRIDGVAAEGTLAASRLNGFALLPRADYISAGYSYSGDPKGPSWGCHCGACPQPPKPFKGKADDFAWTTQLLLAGDDKPDGVNYLILRDSLDIDKASTWTFPAVADAVNCFVAEPSSQKADGFKLQLPGAGAYYVALIPRSSGAIEATAPGDGKVIRLAGAFGADYCFLGKSAGDKATCGEAVFEGAAGAVQDRAGGLMLHLAAPGSVRFKRYGLSGEMPAALRVADDALTVSLSEPWAGGEVVLQAPGEWTPDKASGAMAEKTADKHLLLRVPAGVRTVQLVKAR